MGIVNPRPALRRKGIRRIVTNLQKHACLMRQFEEQGMSREAASERAYRIVTGKEKKGVDISE